MATLSNGQVFDALHSEMVQKLSQSATVLIPDGQDLAFVLLFITLSWSLVTWMLTANGPQTLLDSVRALARYSIVVLMLTGWVSFVGGYFMGAAHDIGKRLTGGATISESVNILMRVSKGLFATTDAANMADCVAPSSAMDPAATGVYESEECKTPPSNSKQPGTWDLLNAFPMVLMTWLLRLITVMFLAALGTLFLVIIFMADITFGIGMILGPILVPWLIWERTQFLFEGWLKYMIVATLQKIVAAVVVMVTALLINSLAALSKTMNTVGIDILAVEEFTAFLMVVVSGLGIIICWQAPQLASALVSGGGGITSSTQLNAMREIKRIPGEK